MTDPFTSI